MSPYIMLLFDVITFSRLFVLFTFRTEKTEGIAKENFLRHLFDQNYKSANYLGLATGDSLMVV